MKILHISAQKPDSTGSGIYLSGLIKGMMQFSSEQALIIGIDLCDSIEKIYEKFDNRIDIYPMIYNKGVLDFDVPGMSDNMPYNSTKYSDITETQAKHIKEEFEKILENAIDDFKPDIILCHHLYFVTSIVRNKYPNKKVVSICHGTCIRQILSNNFQKQFILDNIKKLDMVFALHKEQANQIEKVYCVDSKKIVVLGSGFDNTIFYNKGYKKEDTIKLTYAGKISYSKGLIQLINALDNEKREFKNQIELMIVGDGSNKEEVNYIKKLALQSEVKIIFTGRVNQNELSQILNNSDIFVLPSFYEGLPLVILEALSCGNYIITTDIPGIKEWIGDEINSSGLIQYVKLPRMRSVSIPYDEDINEFEQNLRKAIFEAVKYRCEYSNRGKYIDISQLSWSNLSKKLYENLCSLN